MTLAIGQKLTSGYFGDLYSGTYLSQKCAVKVANPESKESILNEDFFLRYVDGNPNVVRRLGIETHLRSIALITESLDTNLEHHLELHPQGLSLETTRTITRKMLEVLDFLEKSEIFYLNLIPSHILLSADEKIVKLSNFEQAFFNNGPHGPSTYEIKNCYLSPETLLEISFNVNSNIWSLALIINKTFTRTFERSEETANIIASHQFLLETPYPTDLINRGSLDGKKAFEDSRFAKVNLTETLTQSTRRVALEKQEDPEKVEEFLSLLLDMFKYQDRPNAQKNLEHPFLKHEKNQDSAWLDQTSISIRPQVSSRKHLGQGSFGDVYEVCINDNGKKKTYALKISKPDNVSKDSSLYEDRMLRLLAKHPLAADHIIKRFGIFNSPDHRIWLFLEKMSSDLHEYIMRRPSGLSLKQTRNFAEQLLKGLQVLFDAHIIHLDLKPQNILVSMDGQSLKIADFGSAYFKDKACLPDSFYLQTRYWRSPEAILGIPFTPASDMWSFMAVAINMFTSKIPFQANSETELLTIQERRLNQSYPKELLEKASEKGLKKFKAKKIITHPMETINEMVKKTCHTKLLREEQVNLFMDFIMKGLQFDPSQRPEPSQMLMHPFFQSWEIIDFSEEAPPSSEKEEITYFPKEDWVQCSIS